MINLLIVLAGLVILGLSLGLGIVLPISRATAGRRDGQPVPRQHILRGIVGAVIGALTLTLAGTLLNFMRISPDWQVGAQGAILIIVLAARAIINRIDGRTV